MNNPQEFPMTYDQFQRYSVLRELLSRVYARKEPRVLDVGGLSPDREGKTSFLPVEQVYPGSSLVLDLTYHKGTNFIQGDSTKLPFKNGSFDVVAALDVVEHVPEMNRRTFLQELCRVTRGSVLVSAPFKDEKIEKVERLLFEQIKTQYEVEHQQLLEHKRHGLPEIDFISQELGKHTEAGVSFSYGSLKNWLMLQSLKNCLMFRKNSGKLHYYLDKWMTDCDCESEFEPPFSRRFWLYSKDIPVKKLKKVVSAIQEKLKDRTRSRPDMSEVEDFNQTLRDFHCQDAVSAVVVSAGNPEYLVECLNHLLTQKVDFDLEVSLWDLEESDAVERLLAERYPGVKYICHDKTDTLVNSMLKAVSGLKGNFLLFISEEILLPSDATRNFFSHLDINPDVGVLSPCIDGGKKKTIFWGRGKRSERSEDFNSEQARWMASECLFFRREALYERRWKDVQPTKKNIFRWDRTEASQKLSYAPQFTVYKKSS